MSGYENPRVVDRLLMKKRHADDAPEAILNVPRVLSPLAPGLGSIITA